MISKPSQAKNKTTKNLREALSTKQVAFKMKDKIQISNLSSEEKTSKQQILPSFTTF